MTSYKNHQSRPGYQKMRAKILDLNDKCFQSYWKRYERGEITEADIYMELKRIYKENEKLLLEKAFGNV